LHLQDGRRIVLGSGGSNRIRTAILQVIVQLADRGLDLQAAVDAPRLHVEGDLLSVEPGLPDAAVSTLLGDWPRQQVWDTRSLFFGGVHAVQRDGGRLSGAGDPRRGGTSLVRD
jgi:gamma-glutamyltranspeptidase/glutathione hydrolase